VVTEDLSEKLAYLVNSLTENGAGLDLEYLSQHPAEGEEEGLYVDGLRGARMHQDESYPLPNRGDICFRNMCSVVLESSQ